MNYGIDMKVHPYHYQLEDARRIHRFGGRCLVASSMGLGKSLTALLFAQAHPKARPLLIICGAGLKFNWLNECKIHFGWHADILDGLRPTRNAFVRNHQILIVNYDILDYRSKEDKPLGWLPYLLQLKPQLVILDEVGSYLGNLHAKRTQAVRKLCKEVPHILALSGTPLVNRPIEMFPTLNLLRPDLFPSLFQYGHRYCNPPEAPIWMADFSFKSLGEIRIGDRIIGWKRDNEMVSRRGYRGSGKQIHYQRRRLVKTTVIDVQRRMSCIVRVKFASGRIIRCTPDHLWLSGNSWGGGDRFVKAKSKNYLCHVIDPILPLPAEKIQSAGWLGGIYDGEGTWPFISQSPEANPLVYKEIQKSLEEMEFAYYEGRNNHYGLAIKGGRKAAVKFLNYCQPIKRRRIEQHILGQRFISKDKITSITPDGFGEVISLTTRTGNYIAWGYCSKNCAARRNPWSGGWDYSGASNLDELHSLVFSTCALRRRTEEVLPQLPAIQRHVVPLPLSNESEYRFAHNDFVDWLSRRHPTKLAKALKAERLVRMGYLKRLAVRLKIPSLINWFDSFLRESDGKLLIAGIHKFLVHALQERYSKTCVVIDGSTSKKDRLLAEQKFQNQKDIRILIGNIKSAGTGLNLTAAGDSAFAEFDWQPGNHVQFEKRCHGRLSNLHGSNSWWLVGNDTIETHLVHVLERKQAILNAVLDGGKGEDLNVFDQLAKALLQEKNQ